MIDPIAAVLLLLPVPLLVFWLLVRVIFRKRRKLSKSVFEGEVKTTELLPVERNIMQPKYLLLVKVPQGLNILDTPRPQSAGAQRRRAVPVGTPLEAYNIVNIDGVEYGWLVPKDPQKAEWVRVDDGNIEYVEVVDIQPDQGDIAAAIRYLADTIADALSKKASA